MYVLSLIAPEYNHHMCLVILISIHLVCFTETPIFFGPLANVILHLNHRLVTKSPKQNNEVQTTYALLQPSNQATSSAVLVDLVAAPFSQ